MNASNLVLQNMIEQLKVKLLIQALHRQQQKQAIADFLPQLAPTPQLHYPGKTDIPASTTHCHGLLPATIRCAPSPPSTIQVNPDTADGTAEEAEELGSGSQEKPHLAWIPPQTKLQSISQPPTPSNLLHEAQDLNDILPNIMSRISEEDPGRSQLLATDSQSREPPSLLSDNLDASSLSFSELFHGFSDSIDNCSLLGMLGQLKSASPSKESKKGEGGHGALSSEVCDNVHSILCDVVNSRIFSFVCRLQLQTSALKVSFVRILLKIHPGNPSFCFPLLMIECSFN